MQAILMAAGKGSRLGELAANKPKSFVEINGKSLIDINLHMLKAHGIDDICIVTGCHADMFEEKYGDDSLIHLVYNPFYSFTNVIGSFYMGMERLQDDFIYMHADTLCDPGILEQLIASKADIVLPVDTKPCDEEAMKIRTVNGKIQSISKKINSSDCVGEFLGVAKIRSAVLPALRTHTKQLLQEETFSEYFEAALERTILNGGYKTELVNTEGRFWAEIDFIEDYDRAAKSIPETLYRF